MIINIEQLRIDKVQVQSFYDKIKNVDQSFAERHSFTEFLQYFYILCSRFFGVIEYDPSRAFLVPYADLINTNGFQSENAIWDYDPKTMMFKVIAVKKINAGEPLYFSYGHNSNFVYFTFYGMALDPPEYNSIALIAKYDENIPNAKLKAELLNDANTMTKKIRFYEKFEERISSNLRFMEKCRFYWCNKNPRKLCNVTIPLTIACKTNCN